MVIESIINLSGLSINFAGALLIFLNTPKIKSQTVLYQDDELKKKLQTDIKKNLRSKLGMAILFSGFLLQLVGQVIYICNA